MFSRYSVGKKVNLVHNNVILANAAVSKGYKIIDNEIMPLGIGLYLIYYFFNQRRANLQCKEFFISPKAEIARKVWNLVDSKPISFLNKLVLQPITYLKNLYLKRTDPEISLDLISEYLENCNKGKYFNTNYQYMSGDKRFNGKKLLEKITKANVDCNYPFIQVM